MIRVSCPICGQAMEVRNVADWPQFPFCGPRCKTIDLGRWLNETYRIPAEEPDDAGPAAETDLP